MHSARARLWKGFMVVVMAFVACQQRGVIRATIPEGVTLADGKAKAQSGFELVKTGASTAQLRRQNGGIGGEFDCSCSVEGGGGCEVIVTGDVMYCGTGSCGGSCTLTIVVKDPGPSGPGCRRP